MSLLVDQGVPERRCSQVLRSTSVDSKRFESIKFSVCLKFNQIVILWVCHTIPFGFTLFWHFWAYTFSFSNYFLWLRITDEGSVPVSLIKISNGVYILVEVSFVIINSLSDENGISY